MKNVKWPTWSARVEWWNRLRPAERAQQVAQCATEGHQWKNCIGVGVYCSRCLKLDLEERAA